MLVAVRDKRKLQVLMTAVKMAEAFLKAQCTLKKEDMRVQYVLMEVWLR